MVGVGEVVGWFSRLEHHPTHQKVAGLILGGGVYQVICLIPSWGTCGRQPINVSLLLSPFFSH